ncbi:MAG: lamin tail domain-containing protein [Chloroflexota bacterium]
MRRSIVTLLGLLILLAIAGCRSGPPPTNDANQGLAARRQGAVGQLQGVIVIDPKCSNFAQKDDQIVCIVNQGKTDVTIGGWEIRNTIGRTYFFPKGFVLAAGKSVRLHTGAGTNSSTDLYWNYQFKPVFDAEDQLSLVDDGSVVISQYTTP